MKSLSVAGTIAMFLVGGGILVHGLPWLHHAVEAGTIALAGAGGWVASVVESVLNGLVGAVAGVVVLAVVELVKRGSRGR
jgi:predicted DNA repair protein MutK